MTGINSALGLSGTSNYGIDDILRSTQSPSSSRSSSPAARVRSMAAAAAPDSRISPSGGRWAQQWMTTGTSAAPTTSASAERGPSVDDSLRSFHASVTDT